MTDTPRDEFDEAYDYLMQFKDDDIRFREEVMHAWQHGGCASEYRATILFGFCGPQNDPSYGCLTQVHFGPFRAYTPELTDLIRADDRIPDSYPGIFPSNLHVFVEWQRKMKNMFAGIEGAK